MDFTTLAPDEAPPNSYLLPCHREKLYASGLSDETIAAAGIHTEKNYDRCAGYLNWKKYGAKLGPPLVIPYYDEHGDIVLRRLRPLNPRKVGDKPVKYEQPKGAVSRAYFPPGVHKSAKDPTCRLFLTEGELKALCLTQHGWHCIGLAGVECWHTKHSAALLPELERIEWRGRVVYIVFDSDITEKPAVQAAESKLASALKARGAIVKVIRLPSDETGEKQGADDFIVNESAAAFEQLIETAEEPADPDPGDMKPDAKTMDGSDEAAAIVAEMTEDGVSTLRFWNGCWLLWRRGAYRIRRDDELSAEITGLLSKRYSGCKPEHTNCVLMHLKAKTLLHSTVTAPSWIGDSPAGWNARDCVSLRDSVIHLPTLAAEGDFRIDATPRLFTTAACDFGFEAKPLAPQCWLSFLQSVWPDDQQAIDTLQELFGYLLTSDTRHQKIFMLVGPPRSGKGTIQRVIIKLVGEANCCGPTLGSFGNDFGLAPLLGKTVAMISDARLSGRSDSAAILERLLSISGEDTLSVNVKYKEPVNTKLLTRLVLMSNELPRLNDASSAIVSRFIILRMVNSFLGREDVSLDDKLAAELPAIWWWSVQGWRRLNERGRFLQPDSGREQLDELRDLSSPVSAFVRDCCETGDGYAVTVSALFEAWRRWCVEQGRDHHGNQQTFGRDLSAAFPSIRTTRPTVDGSRIYSYAGLRLRPNW